MITDSTIGIYLELIVYFVMTLILVRILFYVRKQSREVNELKRQIELINKAREKK